jgi:hypothetical protein
VLSPRNILALALAAMLAVAGASATAARRVDTRLRVGKGIGRAWLNMTPEQVRRGLRTSPQRPVNSENFRATYRIRRVGTLGVDYYPDTLRVFQVSTTSPRFHYRGLHVGSSRAAVLSRLAGKGWRHLNCPGTQVEFVYYPDDDIRDPRFGARGTIPTAKAQINLIGHRSAREMLVGREVPLFRSSKCSDTRL